MKSSRQTSIREAAVLVRRALELLDDAQAPSDIGAQLDLALRRMENLES